MVCRPCQAAGNQLEAAYRRRITVEGPTYRERHKGRVHCRDCGEDMEARSLASHMMTQHGQVAEARHSWRTPAMGDGERIIRMAFPAKGGPRSFLVEGCLGRAATSMEMRVHFLHRHVLDTVVIMEEGNLHHPWCTRCDMLVPRWALNIRHPATSQCARGGEQNRWRLAEAELRESLERSFEAYGEPLDNVTAFR